MIEFDGLTGNRRGDGATFEQHLGKALDPRFLLDVSVEAANLFIPGAQLARIVVQHGFGRLNERQGERKSQGYSQTYTRPNGHAVVPRRR